MDTLVFTRGAETPPTHPTRLSSTVGTHEVPTNQAPPKW
jgi:hypothetical protein